MKHGPVCTTTLELSQRDGIEIDYCPRCRGVGLDRGELEKLIDRSSRYFRSEDDDDDDDDHHHRRSGDRSYGHGPQFGPPAGTYPPNKEGSFSRLFDVD